MRIIILLLTLSCTYSLSAQSFTYYRTGDTTDVSPITTPGTCLMGGATEHDNAMIWFLERANGGNILVIRASGSDGYNDYLYTDLGVSVQSVETIVFNNASAADDPFVLDRISKAEAIWIAGGDQWNYVNYWRDSSVRQLLNIHILVKQAPIGGTSAGMAVLGGTYFSAQNGTITSVTALNNPFANTLTLGYEDFIQTPFMHHVITDTHYDDPDRRGRHMTFLARLAHDHGVLARGVACDEYTAICIDENGIARAYGEFPTYDDNVYFLQANCEGPLNPEVCMEGSPLTWNQSSSAVKVYHIQADLQGTKTFDLNNWLTGNGGTWENWWVESGAFDTTDSFAPDCAVGIVEEIDFSEFLTYSRSLDSITILQAGLIIEIFNSNGQLVLRSLGPEIGLNSLAKGAYVLRVIKSSGEQFSQAIQK